MFNPSWLLVAVVALALTQIAAFVTSIYLHRGLAHGAVTFHPLIGWLFRATIWALTGQTPREWVAVHRKHHAFTDVEGDPHSPLLLGFWHVQLGNVFYYVQEARRGATLEKFGVGIGTDRWDQYLFSHTLIGPFGVGMGSLALLFGWRGIVIGLAHLVLYVFVVAPLINGLGHWSGQRNFDNTACNHPVLALVTAGEGLHNNHHADQSLPKFSVRWWELDPSWGVIVALRSLGLARLKRPVHRVLRSR